MPLSIPSLTCILKPGKFDSLVVSDPDEQEARREPRATLDFEAVLTRAKCLGLLGRLRKETKQGETNSVLEMLLDLRLVKKLPLDVSFPKNHIRVFIGGQEECDLGDDLQLSGFVLTRLADDNVTVSFTIHGSVLPDGFLWLYTNPATPIELKIKGPGQDDEPEQDEMGD